MFDLWKLKDYAPGEGIALGAFAEQLDTAGWINVPVPGDVHQALIAAGRIPDPFYDRQELDCAWGTSPDTGPTQQQPGRLASRCAAHRGSSRSLSRRTFAGRGVPGKSTLFCGREGSTTAIGGTRDHHLFSRRARVVGRRLCTCIRHLCPPDRAG